ncbi:hypothetical protein BH18ACT17_BH18ACT17_02870 [soil metagenome]
MTLGRRSAFFAALAGLCLLLWEPTPPEYRWVNLCAGGLALLWAAAAAMEDRSLGRWRPRTRNATHPPGMSEDDTVKRA